MLYGFQEKQDEGGHVDALDEAFKNLDMTHDASNANTNKSQSESPVLRKKETASQAMTDEEVFAELRRICHTDDPHKRFDRTKELGAGYVT